MEYKKSLVSKNIGTMRYEHKDGVWNRFIGEMCYLYRNTSSVLEILAQAQMLPHPPQKKRKGKEKSIIGKKGRKVGIAQFGPKVIIKT